MSDDGRRPRRKSPLVNLALVAALLLPVLYVLSYAPVYRWKFGQSPPGGAMFTPDGVDFSRTLHKRALSFYRPVDVLIDKTPLREPLLWWAGLFGVRADFEERHALRLWER